MAMPVETVPVARPLARALTFDDMDFEGAKQPYPFFEHDQDSQWDYTMHGRGHGCTPPNDESRKLFCDDYPDPMQFDSPPDLLGDKDKTLDNSLIASAVSFTVEICNI